MSARACFIERADRGDRVTRIRLIGGRTELVWTPAPGLAPAEAVAQGAAWIKGSLADDERRAVSLLCFDADGGAWTWLSPPSADPRIVETSLRQSGGEALLSGLDRQGEEMEGQGIAPDLTTPGATGLVLLAPPVTKGAKAGAPGPGDQRIPVLSMRDAAARLLIDELDRIGVPVGSVTSIWHVMSAACDPLGPGLGRLDQAEDALQSAPCVGVVILEPRGRLTWCWTAAARTVAGGSLTLPLRAGLPAPSDDVFHRLASEWLSWSMQLGLAPGRIVCLCAPTSPDSLDARGVGEALARASGDAPVDLSESDDPGAVLLARLAGLSPQAVSPPADPRRALVHLAHRPGRAHRAMYRWAALGMFAGAVVLGSGAWLLFSAAGREGRAAQAFTARTTEIFKGYVPNQPAQGSIAVLRLREELQKRRAAAQPPQGLPRAKPIINELDTIMFLVRSFGPGGMELQSVSLNDGVVQLVVTAVDTRMYEDFRAGLSGISGSNINWGMPQTKPAPGDATKVHCTFTGTWRNS